MLYRDWGFGGNPFETTPLQASEDGRKLLVGREVTSKSIIRRLDSSSKLVTVEGLNGVGKTSAINVSVYNAFRSVVNGATAPLYIPCRKIFQLNDNTDTHDLYQQVLLEVAQTLIERYEEVPASRGKVKQTNRTALDRFLNEAQVKSLSGGLTVLGTGIQAGRSMETNSGIGFQRVGIEKQVIDWLEEIFPTSTSGGVVCILDNLELLQTSGRAQEVLEELRDTLFSIRGIRWVLCGALGIIHGVASSPRLDGRLHKPVSIEDLPDELSGQVFRTRVRAFKNTDQAELPINQSQFVEVFDIMRGNLRSALSECDDFCHWVGDRVNDPEDFSEELFEDWLEDELNSAYLAVKSELRPAALKVFETACQFEVFAPSDCTVFGYAKPSAMRPQIKNLEAVGLLQSAIDESDKRRKSIQVTSKGWKVRAYLDFFA
jgi:hypothetical protein